MEFWKNEWSGLFSCCQMTCVMFIQNDEKGVLFCVAGCFFLLNSICKCQEVVFEHKWILVCVLQLVRFTMTGKWGLILVTSQARLGYLRFLDSLTVLEGNAQWSFLAWVGFLLYAWCVWWMFMVFQHDRKKWKALLLEVSLWFLSFWQLFQSCQNAKKISLFALVKMVGQLLCWLLAGYPNDEQLMNKAAVGWQGRICVIWKLGTRSKF